MTSPIKTLVIAGVTAAIVALILTARFFVFPPPSGNSAMFIPAAISFTSGKGLIDEVGHIRFVGKDGSDDSRFISYPPLYPMVLSKIMPEASARGAFIAIGIIESVIVLMTAWLMYGVIKKRRKGEIKWFDVLTVGFGLLAIIGPLLQYNSTRPELLFHLFSLAWLALALHARRLNRLWLAFGIILGLGGATHPLHGVYFALLIGIFFAFKLKTDSAIREILKTYALGAGTTFLIMAMSPYGVLENIKGILSQGQKYGNGVLFNPNSTADFSVSILAYGKGIFRYLFVSPSSFFWGPFLIVVVILTARFWKTSVPVAASRHLFSLFLFGLGATILGLTLGHMDSVYYLTSFGSFFAITAAYMVLKEKRTIFRWILLTVFAIMSVSSLRILALTPSYFFQGVMIGEARELYKKENLPNCENCVGISPANMWVLSENYSSVVTELQARLSKKNLGEEVQMIILGQHASGLMEPPEIYDGCSLEKDYFAKGIPPKILGVKIANIVPGHGFAVYRCK